MDGQTDEHKAICLFNFSKVGGITIVNILIHQLALNRPIATKFVCFSHLLKCLRSIYGKQCGPRSDGSYRSRAVCSGSKLFADAFFFCAPKGLNHLFGMSHRDDAILFQGYKMFLVVNSAEHEISIAL